MKNKVGFGIWLDRMPYFGCQVAVYMEAVNDDVILLALEIY